MSIELTVETVKALVPRAQRSMVDQNLVDLITSGTNGDPLVLESFRNNFLSYQRVLELGKYKLVDYINAIKFVSYKMMDMSDMKAYIATFPDRYSALVAEGKSYDDIAPYVSMYKKGKLVQQIFEQAVIPSHILNNAMFQDTLNELAATIADKAFKVRSPTAWVKAAEAILAHTKAPETAKIELDIGANQADAISKLRETTEKLEQLQRQAIEAGRMTLRDVAESQIIEGEYVDGV